MYAVEFQANIENGIVHIPKECKKKTGGQVTNSKYF